MNYISKSVADTANFAQELLSGLSQRTEATVLALYGDLGSGKTTFSQELGKFLGVNGSIQSPTFVIMKSYTLILPPFTLFVHIDAYRLEKPEELLRLGWKEIVQNPDNLIAVEWAERVEGVLPKDCVRIHFKFVDDTTREITVD